MHARRALAVVPIALLALAAPGLAAPKPKPAPQIVDPKGDSAGGQAGFDILSVEYSTTGVGAGKSYLPKKLVVTMTLSGPPQTQGAFSYILNAELDSCGIMQIRYSPGNVTGTVIGDTYTKIGSCAPDAFWFTAKVKGNVVVFEYALKAIAVDRGTEFSAFTAGVDVSDPVVAEFGTNNVPTAAGALDKASGDGTWLIP